MIQVAQSILLIKFTKATQLSLDIANQGAQGRAQVYPVSKKRRGPSANMEEESQEVGVEILYVGIPRGRLFPWWVDR